MTQHIKPIHLGNFLFILQLDILAEFEIDKEAMKRAAGSGSEYECSRSGGAASRGALGPFGLLVLANQGLTELSPIYFYIYKDEKGNFQTFFCADHSRSTNLYNFLHYKKNIF